METVHLIVHLGISAPDAKTLPVLVEIDDPESPQVNFTVAKYARYLQREGTYSYETIRKYVGAVGKLKDYYALVRGGEAIRPEDIGGLLEDFLFAYDQGSVLGWSSASKSEFMLCRAAVLGYMKFVMSQNERLWPARESRFLDSCLISWTTLGHAKHSLLFHTKKRLRKKTGGRKRNAHGLRQYKPFPAKYLDALLQETANPRDKLLFAILAFGGRRVSEVLNAYMQDVFVKDETLHVTLAHPTASKVEWRALTGDLRDGSRQDYLRDQFGLLPRTGHGALRSALGWKGMKHDDNDTLSSETYFVRDAEKVLVPLYREYLHAVRQRVPRRAHPYFWVNEDGQPLAKKAVEKQFLLARRRVEKRMGTSLKGYALHSLRHYYGFFCVSILHLDLLMLQKCMGHTSITSTAIYAHVAPEIVRDYLEAAHRHAATSPGTPPPLPPAIQRHGLTALGILDTKKLTRRTR